MVEIENNERISVGRNEMRVFSMNKVINYYVKLRSKDSQIKAKHKTLMKILMSGTRREKRTATNEHSSY